jgi:hypothetical protein
MKRSKILLAAAGVLLLLFGWGLRKGGWLFGSHAESMPVSIKSADPMNTQAGWRYRQNLPHHWRYIMLQK